MPTDGVEEELGPELQWLASECRRALDPAQAGPWPDPDLRPRLLAAMRERRGPSVPAARRSAGVPVLQAALALAAAVFVSLVPDAAVPSAGDGLLAPGLGCPVAHARVDAYAGLDRNPHLGLPRARGSAAGGGSLSDGLAPISPPADST